ncbi:MAG: type II toxin-antitoxin system Phd/YefM family antitoxin [Opitutales bacterium]
MITISSTEARDNFAAFLDKGSREVVVVKRQNREVGAFIPMDELRKLQELRRKELDALAAQLSDEGRSNGLTAEILNEILDEVNPS